jgi:hypothetical protein
MLRYGNAINKRIKYNDMKIEWWGLTQSGYKAEAAFRVMVQRRSVLN